MQRAQPGPPPAPVTDASSEVARLQQMVMELQMQLGQHVLGNPAVVSPFRVRKREDYVPAIEQEVIEWMTGKEPCRSSAHLRVDHRGHQESPTCCCFPIQGDQRGEVMSVPRRTVSRYGLRSKRVGEASNPGSLTFRSEVSPRRHRSHSQDSAELSESDIPLLVQRPSSEELLDALQEDLLELSNRRRTRMMMFFSLKQAVICQEHNEGWCWSEGVFARHESTL